MSKTDTLEELPLKEQLIFKAFINLVQKYIEEKDLITRNEINSHILLLNAKIDFAFKSFSDQISRIKTLNYTLIGIILINLIHIIVGFFK